MNSYEIKQEMRRERLERAAARAQARSEGAFARARGYTEGIPLGQPILVGHHSEARHRRALERSHNAMARGIAEQKAAAEYASRAAAVGSAGISSDDPEAAPKIRSRVEELEAEHARMKDVNARFRSGGAKALSADEQRAFAELLRVCPYESKPFPSYALTNSSANIRRLREREVRVAAPKAETKRTELAPGIEVEENAEENRVRLRFAKVPPKDARKLLGSYGFRWSPTERAWQRHYSNQARWAAEHVAQRIAEAGECKGHPTGALPGVSS